LAQKETPAPQMFTGYPVDDHDLVYEAWMRGEFGNRADFRRRNIEKSCQKVRRGVRDVVGIRSGVIADIVKLSDYAARSIG
jgi:hypothetical protein